MTTITYANGNSAFFLEAWPNPPTYTAPNMDASGRTDRLVVTNPATGLTTYINGSDLTPDGSGTVSSIMVYRGAVLEGSITDIGWDLGAFQDAIADALQGGFLGIFRLGRLMDREGPVTVDASGAAPIDMTEFFESRPGASKDMLGTIRTDMTITGSDAADVLFSGLSDALMSGGIGNDKLTSSTGDDDLNGGIGFDTLDGGAGADTMDGGTGADLLFGRDGNDVLVGGRGFDILHGGAGSDTLSGGAEADRLYGGDGGDLLEGGSNAGTRVDGLFGEGGNDTLHGGAGFDVLDGGTGDDLLYGEDQADTLFGRAGADTLLGGAGNDLLEGGRGPDGLFGDGGNDTLRGQDGHDRFFGGSGNDVLHGGAGDDTMNGGAGFDTLTGGAGDDLLWGRFNADVFVFGGAHGHDIVADFQTGNAFERLDMRGTDLSGLADLDLGNLNAGAARQIGADVVITTGADSSVTLRGVSLSDLDAGDFIF